MGGKSYYETAEGLPSHCDAPTGTDGQLKCPQDSVRKPVPIHAITASALSGTTYYRHPHFTGVKTVSQDKKSESGSKAEIQASFLPTAQSLCLPSSAWVVSFAQPTPTLTPSTVYCTQTPCKKTKQPNLASLFLHCTRWASTALAWEALRKGFLYSDRAAAQAPSSSPLMPPTTTAQSSLLEERCDSGEAETDLKLEVH